VENEKPVKNAKYGVRKVDGLRELTNLEADFRRLILEGRDDAIRYNLDKLFEDYERKGLLPPELGSVDELERVVRMLHQIEFDKVLFVGDADGGTRVGKPYVEGAKVLATFAETAEAAVVKADKLYVTHLRRRKNSRRRIGHRQKYLQVTIDTIEV
jgi:large subunit ribosomal protein L21